MMMVVILSVSIMMIVPAFGPLLVRLAALSFVLALVVFLIAFLATPSRLAWVFQRQ